jgi:anaerobic selenocysteine-containing dehydrogenase
MKSLDRRDFMGLSAASSAVLAAGAVDSQPALAGSVTFAKGGRDFSPVTGKERQAIPTACWQCVTRDSLIGFVEDGRLVKLEGHPDSIRTNGVICAKGQAGVNQVYFPDRILHPLRRVGKRGEHKWKRITWDEALDEIAARLKPLLDAGTPEKLMYQYGRNKASQAAVTSCTPLARAPSATTRPSARAASGPARSSCGAGTTTTGTSIRPTSSSSSAPT